MSALIWRGCICFTTLIRRTSSLCPTVLSIDTSVFRKEQQNEFLRILQHVKTYFTRFVTDFLFPSLDGKLALPFLDRFTDTEVSIPREVFPTLIAYAFFCIDPRFSFAPLYRRTNTANPSDPLDNVLCSFYKSSCLLHLFNHEVRMVRSTARRKQPNLSAC